MISPSGLPAEILHALSLGDIGLVNRLTGSLYTVIGSVVHGRHLGRDIGFPTANLVPDPSSGPLPANGVYAVKVTIGATEFSGMANIGYRPTVDGQYLTFEVHLINYSGNLYGTSLVVSFIERLRDEIKFNSIDELVEQLNRDKTRVLTLLP